MTQLMRCNLFQFQNGSIKSGTTSPLSKLDVKFQFQNGSIKSADMDRTPPLVPGFNSKMVQLKAGTVTSIDMSVPTFQFQNGSIKRKCASEAECLVNAVSIPKWFN